MTPLPKPAYLLEIDEGLNWPETAPVLEAQHMHKGHYDHLTDENRHCLVGHVRYWFRDPSPGLHGQVHEALRRRVATLTRRSWNVLSFNDNHSPKLCARIWNATMADLGYTEGNPEA